MLENKKAVIILSGGMDSTTLLHYLISQGYFMVAVSFDYGQKHKKELLCAEEICKKAGVEFIKVDLSALGGLLNSSLTQNDKEVPEGHYESENMKSTVVPNRNLMMLTIANAIGLSKGINRVAFASHAGDHAVYPDCTPIFAEKAEKVLRESSGEDVRILRPFIYIDKTAILRIGLSLKVPYEKTWSCYKGEEDACGKCGTCVERLEAFKECKELDPITYKK